MYAFRVRAAALAVAATIGLSACTTPYGYGGVSVGSGYNGSNYGYGYQDYGYGYGAGYPGYGAGYPGYGAGYSGYGSGYAPYWGWYDGFYYPGSGYYVYDQYRRPHRWTDDQRRHWEQSRNRQISSREFRRQMEAQQQNWSGFDQPAAASQRIQSSGRRQVGVSRGDRVSRSERNVTRVQRSSRSGNDRASRSERTATREQRSSGSHRQSSSDFRRSMEERARAEGDDSRND